MEEVNEKRLEKKLRLNTHQLSDLQETRKINEFFVTLLSMKNDDLETMVLKMNLTYNEIEYLKTNNMLGLEVNHFHFHMENME